MTEKYINYVPSSEERKVMVLFTGAGFSRAIAGVPVMSEFLNTANQSLQDPILSGVHAGYEACKTFKETPNMESAYSALKFLEFGYSGNLNVATYSQGNYIPSNQSTLSLNDALSYFEEAISAIYGKALSQNTQWFTGSQHFFQELQNKVDLAIMTTNYDLIAELSLSGTKSAMKLLNALIKRAWVILRPF